MYQNTSLKPYQPILVQVARWSSTRELLHQAAVQARQNGREIVLLRFVPVFPGNLGSPSHYRTMTAQEARDMTECEATLEDYHICYSIYYVHHINFMAALLMIVHDLNAPSFFASIPPSVFPLYSAIQKSILKRQLAKENCQFFTC